jgi:hypothetical protein
MPAPFVRVGLRGDCRAGGRQAVAVRTKAHRDGDVRGFAEEPEIGIQIDEVGAAGGTEFLPREVGGAKLLQLPQ